MYKHNGEEYGNPLVPVTGSGIQEKPPPSSEMVNSPVGVLGFHRLRSLVRITANNELLRVALTPSKLQPTQC